MVTFTERFNIALKNCPLNISQIAQQSGIKRSKIYALKNGDSFRLWSDNIKPLCQTLGVSADWLLGINGGKKYD